MADRRFPNHDVLGLDHDDGHFDLSSRAQATPMLRHAASVSALARSAVLHELQPATRLPKDICGPADSNIEHCADGRRRFPSDA